RRAAVRIWWHRGHVDEHRLDPGHRRPHRRGGVHDPGSPTTYLIPRRPACRQIPRGGHGGGVSRLPVSRPELPAFARSRPLSARGPDLALDGAEAIRSPSPGAWTPLFLPTLPRCAHGRELGEF